uniref:Transmembrane protein n=1 Tax=Heterorhabditis bacteriophora TaxID=37862 RepID=A0A1I7WXE3_HETBA
MPYTNMEIHLQMEMSLVYLFTIMRTNNPTKISSTSYHGIVITKDLCRSRLDIRLKKFITVEHQTGHEAPTIVGPVRDCFPNVITPTSKDDARADEED